MASTRASKFCARFTTGTSTYTISIYGQHSSTSVVGDNDNFLIHSMAIASTVPDTTGLGFQTVTDPFPFYLTRVQKTDTLETSDPNNQLYMNFLAF